MKLNGILEFADIGAGFVADTEFTVFHTGFRHAEDFCNFGAFPSAHVIFQHLLLFIRQVHGVHECVRFAEVCLLMFKAIYRVHRQSLIVRKVYVFDLLMSVWSVAQSVDEPVYFTIASTFNGDAFSLFIFPVNLVNSPSEKLAQEIYSGLCAIVTV